MARDQQNSGTTNSAHTGAADAHQGARGQETPLPPPGADALEPGAGDVSGGDQPPHVQGGERRARSPAQSDAVPTWEPFIDALPLGTAVPLGPLHVPDPEWLRLEVRRLIREFLSVVPRSHESTTLTFPRPDGTPRTLSRAELSAAIDRMRPRQKQIIRLVVEERHSQDEACLLLNGISLRTLQRDQAEALDLLAQL